MKASRFSTLNPFGKWRIFFESHTNLIKRACVYVFGTQVLFRDYKGIEKMSDFHVECVY